jgi:hypothetical protein
MEDLFTFCILLFCLFNVLATLLICVPTLGPRLYLDFLMRRRQPWLDWQALAAANRLTFQSKSQLLRDGAKVFGHYRGHKLKLITAQTIKSGADYTFTEILLWSQHLSSQPLLPLDKTGFEPLSMEALTHLLAPAGLRYPLRGSLRVKDNGQMFWYHQAEVQANPDYLQYLFDLLGDLAENYPKILALGGEAVAALQELTVHYPRHALSFIAANLLAAIVTETTIRLKPHTADLICPQCLVSCGPHPIKLSNPNPAEYYFNPTEFYGCRRCGQSRTFFEGWLVAVLDQHMEAEQSQHNGVWQINWLTYRHLFDFDEVKIIHASDEQVERFAIQVGNDTDPVRQPRYKQIRCLIAPECHLSENTLRILRRMFGQVEISSPGSLEGTSSAEAAASSPRAQAIETTSPEQDHLTSINP